MTPVLDELYGSGYVSRLYDWRRRPLQMITQTTTVVSRDDVIVLCNAFAETQPEICRAAADPLLVQQLCGDYNFAFTVFTTPLGSDLEQLRYVGDGSAFPQNSWRDAHSDVEIRDWLHCVSVIGDWVVDWTMRQFDPEANVPYVASRDEVLRIWELCGAPAEQTPMAWASAIRSV